MSRATTAVFVSGMAFALVAGYWLGTHRARQPAVAPSAANSSATAGRPTAPGKILYYRHPMGLPDTSPVPKKDSMGMDYVPVYEGEAPAGPGFVVPSDKLQRLGVRTAEAAPRELLRTIRAVGTVQVDERRQSTVSPKFDGYVTQLRVATTGAPVRRGDPLLEVYSPELISAQEEYRVAKRNLADFGESGPEVRGRLESLVAASRARLRNWDIDERDLVGLDAGAVRRTVLLRSPVDGVVIEKLARAGQRFMAGEVLYQVAQLDHVWLVADVFEQDLGALQPGAVARARFAAYPGQVFAGRVAFVYPTLAPSTRTVAVRIELPNPEGVLKPGLYGSVELAASPVAAAVAVPDSAVLDSGARQLVFAAFDGGRFEARDVELGARAAGWVEIKRGVNAGESVVVDGNFLIDAESNLRAGAQSLGHAHGGKSAPAAAEPVAPNPHAGH